MFRSIPFSLVSAIVGGNGTGKTNIFRNINKLFSPYDKQEIVDNNIYIFENLTDDELNQADQLVNLKYKTDKWSKLF